MADNNVTILFMSPRAADFSLTFSLQTTVREVKARLSQEHPSAPPTNSQRIVFAGKLLQDNDILINVFNPNLHNLELPQKFQLIINQPASPNPTRFQNNFNPTYPNANYQNQFNANAFPQNWGYPGYPPQGAYQPPYHAAPFQGQPFQGQPFPGQQGQFQGQPFPPQGQFPGQPFPGQPFPGQQFQGQAFPPQAQFQFQQFQAPNLAAVRGRVINIDFSMIIKLTLFVFLLGQGASTEKILALAFCAIAYYLYMGRNRDQQANNQHQQQQQQNGAQNQQQNVQNQEDQRNNEQNQQEDVPSFYYDPSIKGQILRFVVPFFMSLLPSWKLPNLNYPQPNNQAPAPNPQ